MTTEQKISAIIEDVCAADPSLHAREAELRPLVRTLLESQPDTRFDDAFAAKLRDAVLAKAAASKPVKPSVWDVFRNLKPQDRLVLGTAALGLVLAVSLTVSALPKMAATPELSHLSSPSGAPQAGPSVKILSVADGAFGGLSGATSAPAQGHGGGLRTAESSPTMAPVAPPADMMAANPDAKMIVRPFPVPEQVAYRFVYKGELPQLDEKVDVYRRIKGFAGGAAPVAELGRLTDGAIDLRTFSDAKLQSFALLEDREFGYSIYVDAAEGGVTLSQNWLKWPHPETLCVDDACYRSNLMKPEQVPADGEVIGIADRFLTERGISREAYGAPEVRNDWKSALKDGAEASQIYVPDSVPVVYPLIVGGSTAQDEAGTPIGLTVNVSYRHMRVDSLWGLMSNAYERSSYAAETDQERLRSVIERGGRYGASSEGAAKTVEISLGAPETVLVNIWKYREDGTSDELLVPALRFPVENPPADQPWFQRAVVVPLAKDALDTGMPGAGGGPIIMPMTK